MRNLPQFGTIAIVALASFGCEPATDGTLGGSNTGIVSGDSAAIDSALAAISSTATSVDTSQNAFSNSTQTGRAANSACPEITFSGGNTNGLSLSVALDFGSGCAVDGIDLFCSGSAAGAISTADGTLSLSFDALSCDERSLSGDVTYSFQVTSENVSTTGNWDLSFTDHGKTVAVTSTGNASHNRTTHVTTFAIVDGTATADGDTYDFNWKNVATSFFNNGNFVPQAGQITVTNDRGRTLAVKFDANSPSTGDVLVSVNGGEFVTYNIFEGK